MALLAGGAPALAWRSCGASLCRWQHGGSVYDKMVQVTIVGLDGRRHLVRGLEGQPLVNVLHVNEDAFGEDVVGLSPEGRGALEAHVLVPNEALASIPPLNADDTRVLEQLSPDLQPNSRLASRIKLSKTLNQMVIALGAIRPWKSL
ncbi:hypothetical protein WJX73_000656 [Symbiochloris irregularis]|uniref:Uncharacterized protein n=1 Tax=Symbiochloris irregularis TaxID=706552 RepID=A0AAW1NSR5_9CHLO